MVYCYDGLGYLVCLEVRNFERNLEFFRNWKVLFYILLWYEKLWDWYYYIEIKINLFNKMFF